MFKADSFDFDFMKLRRYAIILSTVLIIASIGLLLTRGLNLGIDFAGGNLLQISFAENVNVSEIRDALADAGQENAVIQAYEDNSFIIRIKADAESVRKEVLTVLRSNFEGLELLRFEKVGPAIGSQMRTDAIIAVLLALAGILIYITVRFQFRFAIASVIALLHDSIITLGFFSLTGREISLPFVAAILTLVGYSLNDTIVVLDRVRENWKNLKIWGIVRLMNNSINRTLSRTINTSLTTFFPVLAFFIFGGPVLANFSIALLIGIIVGTYSSIYVAGSVLSEWYSKKPQN